MKTNRKNIDKAFTEAVAEMFSKGFWISSKISGGNEWGTTANGAYGIASSVEMTNGKEFVRVCVADITDNKKELRYRASVIVAKSRSATYPDYFPLKDCKRTCKATLYGIGSGYRDEKYYLPYDEAIAAKELGATRRKEREERKHEAEYKEFGEQAKRVVLPFVKKQKGFKTCTLENIVQVYRSNRWGKTRYAVVVSRNGKRTAFALNED